MYRVPGVRRVMFCVGFAVGVAFAAGVGVAAGDVVHPLTATTIMLIISNNNNALVEFLVTGLSLLYTYSCYAIAWQSITEHWGAL